MTVTTLLTEITNRCGEGYATWTDRAKAAFRSAVISLIKSGGFIESDYRGLVKAMTYTVGGSGVTSVALSAFLPSGTGADDVIAMRQFAINIGASTFYVPLLSLAQYNAYQLRPQILTGWSRALYVGSNSSNVPTLYIIGGALASPNTITYTAVVWIQALLTTGGADLAPYFTEPFIEQAIAIAAENLMAEINR
jgi:hypothetical protein